MAALGSQSIKDSYPQLLHTDTAGGGNGTTLVPVKDGDNGTTFAMQLSTTTICIDNPTASAADQGGILKLQSDDGAVMASGHRLGVIEFAGAEDTSNTITVGARIEALTDNTWSASENGADLLFYTTDGNASQSEQMRITAEGYVGINEPNPSSLLQVKVGSTTSGTNNANNLRVTSAAGGTGESVQIGVYSGTYGWINSKNVGTGTLPLLINGLSGEGSVYIGGSYNSAAGIVLDSNSRISLSNNDDGASNTIFGKSAGDSDGAGDFNVYIGELSGGTGTQTDASDANVGIGYSALTDITTGYSNVGVGYNALHNVTTGHNNVSIGSETLNACTVGQYNIAIGRQSLYTDDEGNGTTAVGHQAGTYQNLSGTNTESGNSLFGYTTGHYNATGTNNTFIGYQSGYGADGQSNSENTAVGYKAMMDIQSGGANVAIGNNALENATTATVNTAVGGEAMGGITTNAIQDAVAIGHSAFKGSSSTTTGANGTVAVGHDALKVLTSGAGNVAVGFEALTTEDSGSYSTAIGHQALKVQNVDDANNVAIGYNAAVAMTTGKENVIIGSASGDSAQDIDQAVVIGSSAMGNGNATSAADGTVAIGKLALFELTSGANNLAIGHEAGKIVSTGSGNTLIGMDCATAMDTESNNTAIGYDAFNGGINGGTACVAVGKSALASAHTQTGTVAIGASALGSATSSEGSVAIGYQAASAITSGNHNTAIGHQAMAVGTTLLRNTVIGYQAMDDADAGSTVHHDNVFIGFRSGSGTWTSAESSNNTCVGSYTAGANFAGANNNTVVGCNSFGAATSGSDSVVIGQNSGTNITTGGENTIVGYNCTVASNDNTNNVIIGNNLTGTDKDNAVFIGNDTNHIENDFNADATWNYSSDIRQKTNIQDDTLGLSFINNLRTVTYKHKSPSEFPQEWSSYNPNDTEPMGGDKVIHGLIAQEVKKALDKQGIDTFSGWSVGDDGRQRISTEKMVLPLIKAVQELSAKVTELENKLK